MRSKTTVPKADIMVQSGALLHQIGYNSIDKKQESH